jgi:hypothetical protein
MLPSSVSYLHDLGFARAERWLGEHFAHLGERSTLDPAKIYYPERETGAGSQANRGAARPGG